MNIRLNNMFDTSKDILDELFAKSDNGKISDNLFDQACDEFRTVDDDVIVLMFRSKEYEFNRIIDYGFSVKKREGN